MPTQQPRLNLTLDAEMMKMIEGLAKKDKQSLSFTAKKLLLQALELQEDIYFPWVGYKPSPLGGNSL